MLFQSIRRAHKQNFEAAQQKLQAINKSLSTLKKRPNTEAPATGTSDDISMGYHHKYSNNNNNNYIQNASYSSSSNNNSIHSNISNIKYTNSNQNHSSNNNHSASSHSLSERRNSVISNSSSQHLASKSRPRCDSYGGVGGGSDYGSTGKQSPAPSVTMSYLHYNSHSHLADKVVYVTNAVSNAAAAANSNAMAAKYARPKTALSVDTGSGYTDYMAQPQQKIGQQYPHVHGQYSPRDFSTNSAMVDEEDDDDLAGQYATLMRISTQPMDYLYQPMQSTPMTPSSGYEPDSHYSVIGERSSMREKRTSGEGGEPGQSQGLGGYWITLDNNERIWCSLDNRYAHFEGSSSRCMYTNCSPLVLVHRYSSLDRKSQKNKIRKQITRGGNQPPTKSTSLGSFNFITRPDDASDAISVTSANSEQKRLKEKQW